MVDSVVTPNAAWKEIKKGLLANPPSIPPKCFYDRVGSDLSERITRAPEYCLTAAFAIKAFVDLKISPAIGLRRPRISHK